MSTSPWVAILNNPPKVTKEEIDRAQQIKNLIKPQNRYHLPFKYHRPDATNAQPNGHRAED